MQYLISPLNTTPTPIYSCVSEYITIGELLTSSQPQLRYVCVCVRCSTASPSACVRAARANNTPAVVVAAGVYISVLQPPQHNINVYINIRYTLCSGPITQTQPHRHRHTRTHFIPHVHTGTTGILRQCLGTERARVVRAACVASERGRPPDTTDIHTHTHTRTPHSHTAAAHVGAYNITNIYLYKIYKYCNTTPYGMRIMYARWWYTLSR